MGCAIWVEVLGFRVCGSGLRVQGSGFGFWGLGLRFGFWVLGFGVRDLGLGCGVWGSIVLGLRFRGIERGMKILFFARLLLASVTS